MPIILARGEDTVHELRKALTAHLKEAFDSLSISSGLQPEKFKPARKAVKRARAVLKLVETGIKAHWYEAEDEFLKRVARVFRDVRDIQVVSETFEKIVRNSMNVTQGNSFKPIRERILELSKETFSQTKMNEKKLRNALADLQAALERIDEFHLKGEPWSVIREGLRQTYRECIDDYASATETKDADGYIEWRRSVKFLRLQLDYLAEFLTREMREYNSKLHSLSDLLGEYQDLLLLDEVLTEEKSRIAEGVKEFGKLIGERMKEIRKLVRGIGEELFSETPKSFLKLAIQEDKISENACNVG